MKKKLLILVIALIPTSGIIAKSLKVKIAELRQALATHAKSENESWQLLKDLDERVSQIENKYIGYTLEDDIYATPEPTETIPDKTVCVDETENDVLQRTYTRVKEQLNEMLKYGQEALRQAGEKKDQLVQKAKETYQDAITTANHLIAEAKNRGEVFLNETLKSPLTANMAQNPSAP